MSSPGESVGARLFIEGAWREGVSTFDVLDKFSNVQIGIAHRASHDQVDAAVAGLVRGFTTTKLEPYERYRLLSRTAELIEFHRDQLADTIVGEAGFPLGDAAREVSRAAETFRISAEEAKRLSGEMIPIEGAAGQSHRMAFTIRVPRGVVCGITSFNSPLNMVAHKLAPALASGNVVVIKPPEATPLSAARLIALLIEAGWPPEHLALLQGPGPELGTWLVANPDIRFFTFTGSTRVGKWLHQAIGMRPIALELGSIASTIVCEDGDLDRAAVRCAHSGFRRAGQVCTSTQRLFVHASVFEDFARRLVSETRKMVVGDPHDPDTIVGPMISQAEAERAERWVQEALDAGARCLTGGVRVGSLLAPTILTDVRPDLRIVCEEVFGPVLTLIPFTGLDGAIRELNRTSFGLAAGVFTRDIGRALKAVRQLHVGTVHVNDASTSRVDLLPFGGVKDSGIGREGPRYAMREMTEERVVTISDA